MWEKLRIQERDRRLGMLFVSVLVGYSVLVMVFPGAVPVVGASVLGIIWLVMVVRWLVGLRRNRDGAAPVGPLSTDEKQKARAKLLPARRQNGGRP